MALNEVILDEAEISVLGALLLDAEAADRAVELLSPGDFNRPEHRQIFHAILAVHRAGFTADGSWFAVRDELQRAGVLEKSGGSEYLARIAEIVPTSANIAYHARQVVAARIERDFGQSSEEIGFPAAVRAAQARLDAIERFRGASAFRFLDDVEMESQPDPEWLVDGLLPASALAVLFGAPGAGKGFVALDLAFAIATGTAWFDREVRKREVAFIAAEGQSALKHRIGAWKIANEWAGRAGVRFMTDAISFMDAGAVAGLVSELNSFSEPPGLVVVDTLARTMIGGDENSTKDMSAYIAGVDRVRAEVGAAVLLIHHSRKGGDQERGNTALRGAADTMMEVRREDGMLRLECSKQREAPEFSPATLKLVNYGQSAAIVTAKDPWQRSSGEVTENERAALDALAVSFLEDGATTSAWCKAAGMPDRSFYRARTALVRMGYVNQHGEGRGTRYTVSAKGQEMVTATLPSHCQSLPGSDRESLPAKPPPIRGAGSVAVMQDRQQGKARDRE